ncbi:hypothetical protein JTB14_015992 [Gonioctena quinquepunctata]|nr:hypothetical protein JTB14_015992 [Gonioctena quinquepunctata]
MPNFPFCTKSWAFPNNITLADPLFYKPGPIDLLIGADIFWNILGSNKISLGKNMPLLYDTSLGWVVSGQLGIGEATNVSCHLNVNQELLSAISKFWEVEKLPESKKLSDIEQFCETNFANTTTRDAEGRFVVTMPLKQNPTDIDQDVSDISMNRLSRFQLLQQMSQHFWNRWEMDYIAELQRRSKWKTNQGVLIEGSLVLIKGEHTLPTQWILGRICKLHTGPDGVSGVASIKTRSGIVKRGFQKICPLPISA